jgi:hypothetical protein
VTGPSILPRRPIRLTIGYGIGAGEEAQGVELVSDIRTAERRDLGRPVHRMRKGDRRIFAIILSSARSA